VILESRELFGKVVRALCSSKVLTLQDMMSKFKLSPTEVEVLLSALISEGILTRVEVGTACPCAECPLRAVCSIKTGSGGSIATATYYRLSSYGLKFCEELGSLTPKEMRSSNHS